MFLPSKGYHSVLIIRLLVVVLVISCNQNSSSHKTKTPAKLEASTKTLQVDSATSNTLFYYPKNTSDTELIKVNEDSNIFIYAIHNDDCHWSYDCVAKTMNNKWRSHKLICDNMVNLYNDINIRTLQINGRGNNEIVLEYELSGHHLYHGDIWGGGDENLGGWSMNSREVEIWNIDDSFQLVFSCTPYSENWSKEGEDDKNHFDFYKYDFHIDSSMQIVLSNPMKKVKDDIVPDKSRNANKGMGRYKYQSDSFVYIGH
jgi:hypothetical protein